MAKWIKPYPGMVITEDVNIIPGVYNFFELEGLVVQADDLVIDGHDALIIGGKKKGEAKKNDHSEFAYGYSENGRNHELGYHGIGLKSKGTKGVTLQNFNFRGFEIGLFLENCEKWIVLNCDFSYNYHNPDHGWDEHDDLGGICLFDTHDSVIKNNRASEVWNALTLRGSHGNIVEGNNFSHTSNVGLRMWAASHNKIIDNDFSYGLRKEPYEVHARDSACVLVETGSNDNLFKKNDMRYGGDGFFIRSLNNIMSTGNLIEDNDMSFANNNAVEAWDRGNTYIGNKANGSSYGFWLGNSDDTVMINNEIAYNGFSFNNAPEAFGNSGVAVVNGSGTNFVFEGNYVHDNNGPGLAIRNKSYYPSMNWIIKDNKFINNKDDNRGYKGHGIYMKHAQNIQMVDNVFSDNQGQDVCIDVGCSEVKYLKDKKRRQLSICTDRKVYYVGDSVEFSAESDQELIWYIGDKKYKGSSISYELKETGLLRVSVKELSDEYCSSASMNLYVQKKGFMIDAFDLVSSGQVFHDPIDSVTEGGGLVVEGESDKIVIKKSVDLDIKDKSHLAFNLRFHAEMIEWYQSIIGPVITLKGDGVKVLRAKEGFFENFNGLCNESKYEWLYYEIDLNEDDMFDVVGETHDVRAIEISFELKQVSKYKLLLDGLSFIEKKKAPILYKDTCNNPKVSSNSSQAYLAMGSSKNERWLSSGEDNPFYQVDFSGKRLINSIDFELITDVENSQEALPDSIELVFLGTDIRRSLEVSDHVTDSFEEVLCDGIRLEFKVSGIIGLSSLMIYHDGFERPIHLEGSGSLALLDIELLLAYNRGLDAPMSDLIVELCQYQEDIEAFDLLKSKSFRFDEIPFDKPFKVSIDEHLDLSKNYFIALSQTDLQDNRAGNYYRWCSDKIADMNGHYGYINESGLVNSNQIAWGNNWHRLYIEDTVLDYGFQDELIGNRLGIKGNEKLYQKINLSDAYLNKLSKYASTFIERGTYKVTFDDASKIHLYGRAKVEIENKVYNVDAYQIVNLKADVFDLKIIEGKLYDLEGEK